MPFSKPDVLNRTLYSVLKSREIPEITKRASNQDPSTTASLLLKSLGHEVRGHVRYDMVYRVPANAYMSHIYVIANRYTFMQSSSFDKYVQVPSRNAASFSSPIHISLAMCAILRVARTLSQASHLHRSLYHSPTLGGDSRVHRTMLVVGDCIAEVLDMIWLNKFEGYSKAGLRFSQHRAFMAQYILRST